MIKKNSKLILGIIIGLIISIGGVYAANELTARDVRIDKTNGKLANIPGNTVEDALDYLHTQASKIGTCPEGWMCRDLQNNPMTASELKIGDLVKMVPTLSSFTTDKKKTGYSETQTINPQELQYWRVIKRYDDGTVDVVSEYVSSTKICFTGATGYQNFATYLWILASKYANSNYTGGSRHIGYDGTKVTGTLTSTAKYDGSSNSRPWSSPTSESTTAANEALGAGDTGYRTDYNLVKEAYKGTTTYGSNSSGTLKAYTVGTTTATDYWLASRLYQTFSSTDFLFDGNYVNANGDYSFSPLRRYENGWKNFTPCYALRPILTLKADVTSSSVESSTGAYILD